MEPPEKDAAEDLLDDLRVDLGKRQELALLGESAPSRDHVDVRVKIRSERAEGLDRGDAARPHVAASKGRLDRLAKGVVGASREDPEKLSLALEEATENLGDREGPHSCGTGAKTSSTSLSPRSAARLA